MWLWCRPAAAAPIQPLAWKLPYVAGAALKKKKDKTKTRYFQPYLLLNLSTWPAGFLMIPPPHLGHTSPVRLAALLQNSFIPRFTENHLLSLSLSRLPAPHLWNPVVAHFPDTQTQTSLLPGVPRPGIICQHLETVWLSQLGAKYCDIWW